MPQSAVILTIQQPATYPQKSNLSAGVNTGVFVPGLPVNLPGALAGSSSSQVYSTAPRLGMPIVFG